MKARLCRTSFADKEGRRYEVLTVLVLLFVAAKEPRPLRAEPYEPLPKVLMAEIEGLTPNNPDLYKAIRAQLSASPLILDRIEINDANATTLEVDLLNKASTTAEANRASMVFWIKDEQGSCTLFFYVKDAGGDRIQTRVLNLASGSSSSRFETIANAASSVIEECVATLRHMPLPRKESPVVAPPSSPKVDLKKRRVELFAGYSGSLFAKSRVTHGVEMGLGFLATDHLAVDLSYTQNVPLELNEEGLELSLTCRKIEVAFAGRIIAAPFDIRIGLAGTVDLRSVSTTSSSKSMSPRPGDLQTVYSLTPFVSAAWIFQDRFGITTAIGADIAFEERTYSVLQDDGGEKAFSLPFIGKLIYQLGLVVRL